jgi:hypothetical protein
MSTIYIQTYDEGKILVLSPNHGGVWGSEIIAPRILLYPSLDGGEWSGSLPGHLTPGEGAAGPCWLGGCVSPIAGLDAVEKNVLPPMGIEIRFFCRPTRNLVAILTELSRLL